MTSKDCVSSRAWYAAGVLVTLFVLSFFGRQIISLMVDPIERSLGLTEVQIGLLIGFAFTLLFTLGGVFFGLVADLYPKRIVIFLGTLAWSVSCIACGFARSFTWLFIARMGVGIGEATLVPAAYALLSEVFPRDRLATALGVFSFGACLGIALSLAFGGFLLGVLSNSSSYLTPLGRFEPWQIAFMLAGIPALAASTLALTLPEGTHLASLGRTPNLVAPLRELYRRHPRVILTQFAGFSMNAFMGYSLMAWTPAFMGRQYGWRLSAIGPSLALVFGISGALATMGSGLLADRLTTRGVRGAHFVLASAALAIAAPFGIIGFHSTSPALFLGCAFALYFASALSLNMGATSLQLLTPAYLRGRVSGLYLLCTNMIGAGLGPLSVAGMTQHLFHDHAKLGLAMSIVTSVSALVGAALLSSAKGAYGAAIAAEGLRAATVPEKVTPGGV